MHQDDLVASRVIRLIEYPLELLSRDQSHTESINGVNASFFDLAVAPGAVFSKHRRHFGDGVCDAAARAIGVRVRFHWEDHSHKPVLIGIHVLKIVSLPIFNPRLCVRATTIYDYCQFQAVLFKWASLLDGQRAQGETQGSFPAQPVTQFDGTPVKLASQRGIVVDGQNFGLHARKVLCVMLANITDAGPILPANLAGKHRHPQTP